MLLDGTAALLRAEVTGGLDNQKQIRSKKNV
jgi:hypothetical protein